MNVIKAKSEVIDKTCMRQLQVALPHVVYNYIHVCTTTQQICNKLKEKFQGIERTKKSYVT